MTEAHPTSYALPIDRIYSAVRAHEPVIAERDGTYFEAAVALVLRIPRGSNGLEMLFIKRAARADDPWSGQIAFPGGRRDAVDLTLEETAVRETREEVGLELSKDSIIGALDELRPRITVLPPVIVRPFVAWISPDAAIVTSDEVAGSFWAPLTAILDPAASRVTAIDVRGARAMRPAIHYEGHVIWGMTENILRKFAEIIA